MSGIFTYHWSKPLFIHTISVKQFAAQENRGKAVQALLILEYLLNLGH